MDYGIQLPALQHQWEISTSLPDDIDKYVTTSAIKCSLNLVGHTFKLLLEQPRSSVELFEGIDLMTHGSIIFTLDHMNGKDGNVASHVTFEATLIEHKYSLDYTKSETTTHDLVFNKVKLLKLDYSVGERIIGCEDSE